MAYRLQIAQLGNRCLRTPAETVSLPASETILDLCQSMILTLRENNGVGLAATQVYQSLQIMILHSFPNPRYPHAPSVGPELLFNPQLTWMSPETVKDWEGCLSIPGFRGIVPRARSVKVDFYNDAGEQVCREFSDFPARIIQHEYDHLHGKVFLDRIEKTSDLFTEIESLKHIAKP